MKRSDLLFDDPEDEFTNQEPEFPPQVPPKGDEDE